MQNELTRIQALNLKGKNHDYTLTPLTAVVGPNTGGKSAVAAAVTIALLGHIPALGKQAPKTVQLMTPGAPMLDVQAFLGNGERINRRFDVNPKSGAVKTSATGPDFGDLNQIQLDFGQFQAAKPTERQRILEGLLTATADADVLAEARTRIAKAGVTLDVKVGEGWLLKLEADAKEAGKMAKQESDTAAKTILQLQGEEAPAGFDAQALATTQATLATARETFGAKRATLDALAEDHQNAPDKPEGDEVTQAMIDEAVEAEASALQTLNDWNRVNVAHQAAVEQAAEIRRPHARIEPKEAAGEVLTGDELNAQARKLHGNQQELSTAYGIAKSNLADARKTLAKALEERAAMLAGDCCPTCKTQGDAFRKAFAEAADKEIERLTGLVEDHQARETKLSADIDALVAEQEKHAARCKEREQHAAFLAEVRAVTVLDNAPAPKGAKGPLEAAHAAAKAAVSNLRRDAQQWISWRAAKIPTPEQLATAEKEFADAKAVVESLEQSETALKAKEQAVAGWRANQAKMAELERDNVKRASEMEALKDLAAWAKAKSLELTAEAMKPLLAVCNSVLTGVVNGEIAIDGTVVGVKRDGHLIPLEVLSGSEAVALSSAIQIAIAGTSAFRIVMIDELSRFESDRKVRFVENLHRSIQDGLLDQVIVFDHDRTLGPVVSSLEGGSMLTVS